MTEQTEAQDYNTLKPLFIEFEGMRGTIGKLIQLIKQQDTRIAELEQKLSIYVLPTAEQTTLDRLTLSSSRNRDLSEKPHVIAYAAHLRKIKQVPAQRLYKAGLMTQSKLHGLDQWEAQHLLDFCEVNGVMDVYRSGLSDTLAREIVPKFDELKTYLDKRGDKTE